MLRSIESTEGYTAVCALKDATKKPDGYLVRYKKGTYAHSVGLREAFLPNSLLRLHAGVLYVRSSRACS